MLRATRQAELLIRIIKYVIGRHYYYYQFIGYPLWPIIIIICFPPEEMPSLIGPFTRRQAVLIGASNKLSQILKIFPGTIES